MIFGDLFSPVVRWTTMDPAEADPASLPQVEHAQIASAIPVRQREYAAVRQLARRLFADVGAPLSPVPNGEDRAPRFPAGIVGSFSHSRTVALAAIAWRSDIAALGCDVEPQLPLPSGVAARVLSPAERAFLLDQPVWLDRLVFSAKESAYKAQYQLSGAFLDFDAMAIDLDLPNRGFIATLRVPAGPLCAGYRFAGRFCIDGGSIATAVAILEPP